MLYHEDHLVIQSPDPTLRQFVTCDPQTPLANQQGTREPCSSLPIAFQYQRKSCQWLDLGYWEIWSGQPWPQTTRPPLR